jgi:hypothetical protein
MDMDNYIETQSRILTSEERWLTYHLRNSGTDSACGDAGRACRIQSDYFRKPATTNGRRNWERFSQPE